MKGKKNKLKQIKVMFLHRNLPISVVNHSEKDEIKCFSGRILLFGDFKAKRAPIPVGRTVRTPLGFLGCIPQGKRKHLEMFHV